MELHKVDIDLQQLINILKQIRPSDFKLTPKEKARAERIGLVEEQSKMVDYVLYEDWTTKST